MRLAIHIAAGLVFLLAGVPSPARAQVDESELKAAFIFNFVAFVTWPPGHRASGNDVLVCIRADLELQAAVIRLNRRRVGSRRIMTKLLGGPDDVESCDVVVAGSAERSGAETVSDTSAGNDGSTHGVTDVRAAAGTNGVDGDTSSSRSIDDIGEEPKWPEQWWRIQGVLSIVVDGSDERSGAIITLVRENTRIGFDVDIAASRQAGLVLSSKLLRLARKVQ
jgi:hypothetical protein